MLLLSTRISDVGVLGLAATSGLPGPAFGGAPRCPVLSRLASGAGVALSLGRSFFDHGSASFRRRSFGEACLGRRGLAGGDGKLLRQLRRFGRSEGLRSGRG